jgi:hypothetical protein
MPTIRNTVCSILIGESVPTDRLPRRHSRYGHLKAEVTNCTPDDGHIWCPKHVEAIKLHILSHLVGSLPFDISINLFVKNFVCSGLYIYVSIFILNSSGQTEVYFQQDLHSLKPSFQFAHTTIPQPARSN